MLPEFQIWYEIKTNTHVTKYQIQPQRFCIKKWISLSSGRWFCPVPWLLDIKLRAEGCLIHLQNICRFSCRRWQLTIAINPGMLHFSTVYFYKHSAQYSVWITQETVIKEVKRSEWKVIVWDFWILFRKLSFIFYGMLWDIQ